MISMGWDGGDISGGAGAGRGSAVLHWRAGEPGGQRAAGLVQPADGEGTAHDIARAGAITAIHSPARRRVGAKYIEIERHG